MNEDLKMIMDELKSIKDDVAGMESHLNKRFDGLENRIDGLENRIDGLEERVDGYHAGDLEAFETLANKLNDLGERISSLIIITQKNSYDIALMKQRKA